MKRSLFLFLFVALASIPVLAADNPRVRLATTAGDIVVELDPVNAPLSTENFLRYTRDGHYDGTIFHRVIDNFMIQGGGFNAEYKQKKTRDPIKNEADNGLKNMTGTLAMARTSVVDSATSQFFINVADNDFLNHTTKTTRGWGYAVFGKVVEGMDIIDKIRETKTGRDSPCCPNAPIPKITINKASVEPTNTQQEYPE